ncbi:BQ2448_2859 [Microbotryum intermedium]|uniref:BQ2448_2859 protein n=1 Tax=Microbotryum intermedium TaxID=269621 RepID=A0A238FGL0_9BASI|nr:BQ2448_2859 [Microbotryum intermedium]
MRPNLTWSYLALLLSCLGTLALSQPLILIPYNPHDSSRAAQGVADHDALQNQALQTLSVPADALALRNREEFVWATEKDKLGASLVATMHMETFESEKVLNTQRFDNLLANVDCSPSEIILTFKAQATFVQARHSWYPLNENNMSHVALFTDWKGCATPAGNLKPFHLTSVSFESKDLTARFRSSEKDWKTAAHTFTMLIGKHSNEGFPSPLAARSSVFTKARKAVQKESKANIFKEIKKHFKTKIVNIDQELLTISFDKSFPGKKELSTPEHADGNGSAFSASVACTNCGPRGSLVFEIKIEVTLGAPPTTTLIMRTQNLGFSLDLAMSAKSKIPQSVDYGDSLLETSIPGTGFRITEIIEFGLVASLDYGVSVSDFQGDLNISKKVVFDIPNGAAFDVQLPASQKWRTALHGDWKPVTAPTPMQICGFGSGELAVNLGISVSVEMKILNVDIKPVQISLGGPSVAFEMGVASKSSAPCSHFKSSGMGPTYHITPKIGFSLSVSTSLSLGANKWGLQLPLPLIHGGGHGKGGGKHLSPTDSTDMTHPSTDNNPEKGPDQLDTFGASKPSLSLHKTLFEKTIILHKPYCYIRHQKGQLLDEDQIEQPDGGPCSL